MATREDKILKIQSDRLSECLKITPGSKFTREELNALLEAKVNQPSMFRGKEIHVSMSIKACAAIMLEKI
jgi:hypothetical protein